MKLACSTVVFRQHPLDKALDAIRKIGYEYIETQAMSPWCPHADIDKDDPVAFARHVAEFGIKGITGLWMPHGRIIADDQYVEYGIRSLEWAKAAGIPVLITGDGAKPGDMDDETAFHVVEARLPKVLEVARKLKVKVAIEPHGTFSLTMRGLQRLMSVSNEPWLGINYDAANIHRACYVENRGRSFEWTKYENRESEQSVLSAIADRVIYFHAKDLRGEGCTALGEGDVKVAECMEILLSQGYNGTFSLETEGNESFEDSLAIACKSFEFLQKNTGL